jgi:primosomal protein N'
MPSSKPWLDYYYEASADLKIGQIVKIKIRGKLTNGIAWKINQPTSEKYKLVPITGTITDFPIVTEYQQARMSEYAEIYGVSLSNLVTNTVPQKIVTKPKTKIFTAAESHNDKQNECLWYRSRKEAEEFLIKWDQKFKKQWRVIFVPTITDLNRLAKILPHSLLVHGQISDQKYRKMYEQVLNTEAGLIIGTSKMLFLPFYRAPKIIVDQIEHRQYKQDKRRPFLHLPTGLRRLKMAYGWTSPAPDLISYEHGHLVPPATVIARNIADLSHQNSTWLAAETENKLADHRGSIVWILPRAGFATGLICADCRWALECPKCQRRIRFKKLQEKIISCEYCHHQFTPAVNCPKCGGVKWKTIGIGPEFWKQELQKTKYDKNSIVDTYKVVDRLRVIKAPVAVVIVSGDAMIDQPDFSINERCWQYLHRLEANLMAGDQIIVQTYNPANDLWQDWIADRKASWYQKEIAIRQKFELPPQVENIIVSAPAKKSLADVKMVANKINAISDQAGLRANIMRLSRTKGENEGYRILIRPKETVKKTFEKSLAQYIDEQWKVDIDVQSWLA